MRIISPALIALLLTGCSLSLIEPGREGTEQFILIDEHAVADPAPATGTLGIAVGEVAAPVHLDGDRILFTNSPLTRSAYQFATWIEPPPARIRTLIAERLSSSGVFRPVSTAGGEAGIDLTLALQLSELYHDVSTRPGLAVIRLKGEVLRAGDRRVIATRSFTRSTELTEYSARGAVSALSSALTSIIDELVRWAGEVAQADKVP